MNNMKLLIREFSNNPNVGVVAVGTTPKAYEKEVLFCRSTSNIRVGLGIHPQLIAERWQETELLLKLIDQTRFIGEVGLDLNSAYISSKQQQINCFRKIIKACADRGNKVISIHCVKSVSTVLDELESVGAINNCICILHWFSGTSRERRKAIEDGVYFSINPRMTRTKTGQETIQAIPKDKILLETDSPFTMKFRHVADLEKELELLVERISSIRGKSIRKNIEENSNKIWNESSNIFKTK